MEKGWRKKFDEVHDKIMDGYRRGVCNKNGESVKVNGRPVAKPRLLKSIKNFDPTDTFLERYRKGLISGY